MGVEHLVVALTKAEQGKAELTELVELDVRALLNTYGFAGVDLPLPVLRVSAERALADDPRWTGAIEALLDAVDTYVPQPERDTTAPLVLPVASAAPAPGGGTRATGTVERGTVRTGDRLRACTRRKVRWTCGWPRSRPAAPRPRTRRRVRARPSRLGRAGAELRRRNVPRRASASAEPTAAHPTAVTAAVRQPAASTRTPARAAPPAIPATMAVSGHV